MMKIFIPGSGSASDQQRKPVSVFLQYLHPLNDRFRRHGQGIKQLLIGILRKITLAVQIAPFVFGAIYIAIFVSYLYASDETMTILDTLFYVSPLFCLLHLVYSKILHLCAWHRTACVVPLIPQVVNVVDFYLVSLSDIQALAFNAIAAVMTILLIVAAYNVFLK